MTTARDAVTDELEHLLADADEKGVDVPTQVPAGHVVNKPTEQDPYPMAISELREAGWVIVYDIRNGDPSVVNRNMLRAQLQKKDPVTGNRVFTTVDPGYRPKPGAFTCWLHAENEHRAMAEEFGFDACRKQGIRSAFDAERHTRNRHPQEYAAMREAQQRAREDENALRQERLIEAAIGARAPQAAVAEAPAIKENPSAVGVSETCECGEVLDARNAGGLNLKRMHHRKKCKIYSEN